MSMKTVTDGCTLMDLLYVCHETRCFEFKKEKKKEKKKQYREEVLSMCTSCDGDKQTILIIYEGCRAKHNKCIEPCVSEE